MKMQYFIDLSVLIPARNESENLSILLPQIHAVLRELNINYEIIIVDENADVKTRDIINRFSSKLITPLNKGYGTALKAGFQQACGQYIVTMDADLSHSPNFLISLWNERNISDIVVASRYIKGGIAIMPISRLILSRIFNLLYSRGLDLKVNDMSSGFRLYKASIVKSGSYSCKDFNILQEILVLALINGYKVHEIPFTYQPRRHGSSHTRVIKFGIRYIQTFASLWKIRNSIASADYDARAYDTVFIPQRYWQRQRYKYITKMISSKRKYLDIGCGSSRILGALPEGSIGLDILISKLRYSRCYKKALINGSATALPIAAESIECIVCSELIEHIPRGSIFFELDRVLAPNGILILGTPDYSKWQWNIIEKLYKLILPQAYADEHISHYTHQEIIREFVMERGYTLLGSHYVLQGELILSLQKL